jgi:hypothetical protein
MAQLLVRNLEDTVVRHLRRRAAEGGLSVEEAHRQLLREVLLGETRPRPSFKEYLLEMPWCGGDEVFLRERGRNRPIEI